MVCIWSASYYPCCTPCRPSSSFQLCLLRFCCCINLPTFCFLLLLIVASCLAKSSPVFPTFRGAKRVARSLVEVALTLAASFPTFETTRSACMLAMPGLECLECPLLKHGVHLPNTSPGPLRHCFSADSIPPLQPLHQFLHHLVPHHHLLLFHLLGTHPTTTSTAASSTAAPSTPPLQSKVLFLPAVR